ncbi:DEAD/DEAH box helicase family protein [uncultured Shewanella sp.]|uniref:DEAD/DEAH box helicase family protein n=1 Tax=uncultured Shewanella sp. TaxID=173975 RepID=UPI002627DABD|nr:DEAD/DEAH box helicase family protein [uncultured Shewanella sp.]
MISIDSAKMLIDFSAGVKEREPLAEQQIEGSVALYNILQNQDLAYLADEVGMGKTYVALGTIALMRKQKPDLRVLYLLPKNNVRDKWVKDYKSFVEYNYRQDDLTVRSLDRSPAAPYVICKGLEALIREAAMGNNQDLFICASALSFTLGNDVASLQTSLKKLLKLYSGNAEDIHALLARLEQSEEAEQRISSYKKQCKQLWATAINRILPQFDLIVVDEAHNFKRGLNTSDRNRNLAVVLGTEQSKSDTQYVEKPALVPLVNKVMLLSATPYEYDLSEMERQLVLFGSDLLSDKKEREDLLSSFMVRRLNEMNIEGKKHTRNMYRDEHRSGEKAEVQMNDAQKLFAALMQKRVSEHLRQNHAGKYQTGLLASFESYLPSKLVNQEHATFDGDEEDRKEEARDDNVVEQLISSFKKRFDQIPPHPKMDWVAKQLHQQVYLHGRKQLIFVRRVASVGELKNKFEELYDKLFIGQYIQRDPFVSKMYDYYLSHKYQGSLDTAEVTSEEGKEANKEGDDKATSDDFFSWFYRGRNDYVEKNIKDGDVTPHNFRQKVAQRSTMFELNWAKWLKGISDKQYDNQSLIKFADGLKESASDTDEQKRFQVAQYCYLSCLLEDDTVETNIRQVAGRLFNYLYHSLPPKISKKDKEKLADALNFTSLFEQVSQDDELFSIFPLWTGKSLSKDILLQADVLAQDRAIHLREILRMVLAYICRVDHPWIDLYSIRGQDSEKDSFINLLKQQYKANLAFSSYKILKELSQNIELLIKLNFSEAYRKPHSDLMRYISNQIRNLQSCAGASGINSGDRSPLARRFRMPGYPMVLISTDVFQEGEDLHTFCDSVSHYGISASPIALEQKVGRVDRIGSMAQRGIMLSPEDANQHFIQVRFPHVKESIEYMQVQHSAFNLNRFIKNLHKVSGKDNSTAVEVDIDERLSAIEPQIRDHLKSPFVAAKHTIAKCEFDRSLMECQKDKLESLIADIQNRYLGGKKFEKTAKGMTCTLGKGTGEYDFEIRAARKSNELVLSITKKWHEEQYLADALQFLKKFASQHICRLQVEDNSGIKVFSLNVERLYSLQDEGLNEYEATYEKELLENDAVFAPLNIYPQISEAINGFKLHHQKVSVSENGNAVQFDFECSKRKQIITTTENDEYYCICSTAISPEKLAGKLVSKERLDTEKLLKYTAGRNLIYDLVDFYVDNQDGISVRAFCRKTHCSDIDVLRIMFRVAREADRLEYLFSDVDQY